MSFHASQRGSEAEVDAVSEREVLVGLAAHVEAEGVREDGLVTIRARRAWRQRARLSASSLAEITVLFTDRPLPQDLARKCAEWGTEVVVAPV